MPSSTYDRLRRDLITAMKQRDQVAVSAIRTAIAAIDNASAVDVPQIRSIDWKPGLINEVPRREVDESETLRILEREIDEKRQAIQDLDGLGEIELVDLIERLRSEVEVLTRYVVG